MSIFNDDRHDPVLWAGVLVLGVTLATAWWLGGAIAAVKIIVVFVVGFAFGYCLGRT